VCVHTQIVKCVGETLAHLSWMMTDWAPLILAFCILYASVDVYNIHDVLYVYVCMHVHTSIHSHSTYCVNVCTV
jgi:hypothetical protein